ncbi:MAG: O-antigen ligase family protein, partial [bacterium]
MNQRLVGWIFALGILLLVFAGMVRGNFIMAGASIMLFFLAPMASRPGAWWMMAVATAGSGLTLGLPGRADLHLMITLGFIATILIQLSTSNRQVTPPSVPRKACIALVFTIIITAAWRGTGLKILGGDLWGGMRYVSLLAALLFYIYSPSITVSQKHLVSAVRWLFIFSLIPAVSCLTVHFLPSTAWLGNVVQIGETEGLQWQASSGTRWVYMQFPAIWMGVWALLTYERRFRFTPTVALLSALSFGLLGLSGHRAVVVLLGLTTFVYVTIKRHDVRLWQLLKLAGVLTVLVVLLYLLVEHLPHTFQRAFTWLPGLEVTYEAEMDAALTSKWRIELWRQLLLMVPDYLWIGRGLAYSAGDANAASMLASDRSMQYVFFTVVHLYHNGPLWLILDLGLAGLA